MHKYTNYIFLPKTIFVMALILSPKPGFCTGDILLFNIVCMTQYQLLERMF